MKKLTFLLLLMCCFVNVRAANTLRIINDVPASVADPTNIFIQLDYVTASIDPPLDNFEVVYPFTDAVSVWTLVITNINSGNLKFGIDPVHEMEDYSKVGDPDVHLMFNGLFEFSLLATDTVGYWDISNVDWIGMLCSVTCTTGGYPNATWQLRYYKKASELISMMTNEYQFTAAQTDQVLVRSNAWPSSWRKLMAPNHEVDAYVDSPGGKTHLVDYLYRLESNSVPMLLKANLPSTDTNHFTGANPPDWQNRVAALGTTPAAFTGGFQEKSAVVVNPPIPGPGLTNEIVLVLSNESCRTVLYYSTEGINPGTTYRNDSDGGLWVLYCTDTNAGTWEWVITNAHLNCVTPGDPSFFEDWLASLANKVCYSINAGLIPTNSNPTNVYTFSGFANLVQTETNSWEYPPYQVNMYNNIIVNNSDSYGMGYSDANPFGTKKVVQQTKKDGGIVELRLLDPDAEITSQRITFQNPGNQIMTNTVVLAATASSGLPVTFAVVFGPAVLSASNILSFTSMGIVKIKASQAGDHTWDPAPSVTNTFRVTGRAVLNDYDGDGKSDLAVFEVETGYWYILFSDTLSVSVTKLGHSNSTPTPDDFDGDLKCDLTVYDRPTQAWSILYSSTLQMALTKFGNSDCTPVSKDYDGDLKSDMAVFDRSTGYWHILPSSTLVLSSTQFGNSDCTPAPADFDGDGKADLAVFERTTGYWYILLSSTYRISIMKFGNSDCTPVPGDYDGDGKADVTVFERSTGYWYIFYSSTYELGMLKFGNSGCTPVAGDYDGDGKADLAVYENATGYWYILMSSTLEVSLTPFGNSGYVPVQ